MLILLPVNFSFCVFINLEFYYSYISNGQLNGTPFFSMTSDCLVLPSQDGWQYPIKCCTEQLEENFVLQLGQTFKVWQGQLVLGSHRNRHLFVSNGHYSIPLYLHWSLYVCRSLLLACVVSTTVDSSTVIFFSSYFACLHVSFWK